MACRGEHRSGGLSQKEALRTLKLDDSLCQVAYRVMLFLRTSMAVLNYSTDGKPNWKVEELNGAELEYVMDNLLFHPQNRQYAILSRSEYEENIRVPILVALLLRRTLAEHEKRLPKPLELPQEMRLFASVDACMAGFTGLRKFKSTPVPFPLVQMARVSSLNLLQNFHGEC
jgi:hypothetical protein